MAIMRLSSDSNTDSNRITIMPDINTPFGPTYEEQEAQTREAFENLQNSYQQRSEAGSRRVRRGALAAGMKDYTGNVRDARYKQASSQLLGQRETSLENIDRREYNTAVTTKPQFIRGMEDPNNYVYGSYETYGKALADWTEKNKLVLGRGDDRYKQSLEEIELAKEQLKNISNEDFTQAVSSMPLGVSQKQEDYIPQLNQWVDQQKNVLGREEYYDVASKILAGNLNESDLTDEGKVAANQILLELLKFKNLPGEGGALVSGKTETYPEYFSADSGWVYKPYMVGEYKVLDPNTLTVKVYNASKTGKNVKIKGTYYDNKKRKKYEAARPEIKTTLVGEYKLETPTVLSKAFALQNAKKNWGYTPSEGEKAATQYRQNMVDRKYKEQQTKNAYADLSRLVQWKKDAGIIPSNMQQANPLIYGTQNKTKTPQAYSSLFEYQAYNPSTKIAYETALKSFGQNSSTDVPAISKSTFDTYTKVAKLSGSGFTFSKGMQDKIAGIFR
jgi:hypothetical protein